MTCDYVTIRIIDSKLKFILFLFLFIFYLEKLGLGFSMILHVTVINGYMIRPSIIYQSHNTIEGSRRNNII